MGNNTEVRWPGLTSARSLFPRSPAAASLWKAGQAKSSKEKADFFFFFFAATVASCSHQPTGKGGMSPSYLSCAAAAASQEDSQEDCPGRSLGAGMCPCHDLGLVLRPHRPWAFQEGSQRGFELELEPSELSAAFQGTPQALRKGPPKAAAGFKGVLKGDKRSPL